MIYQYHICLRLLSITHTLFHFRRHFRLQNIVSTLLILLHLMFSIFLRLHCFEGHASSVYCRLQISVTRMFRRYGLLVLFRLV